MNPTPKGKTLKSIVTLTGPVLTALGLPVARQ